MGGRFLASLPLGGTIVTGKKKRFTNHYSECCPKPKITTQFQMLGSWMQCPQAIECMLVYGACLHTVSAYALPVSAVKFFFNCPVVPRLHLPRNIHCCPVLLVFLLPSSDLPTWTWPSHLISCQFYFSTQRPETHICQLVCQLMDVLITTLYMLHVWPIHR